MEGDKHFSHDHPLISFNEENYDDVKEHSCHICGLPILSSLSYTCPSKTCNFFMHETCFEFPENLSNHPIHDFTPHEDHNLQLRPSGKNFTYKCQHCEFHIHPLDIQSVEIKTMHKSHPQHPLVAFGKETLCRCNACAEEHKGFFFFCLQCNFCIHQDCTILPTFVRINYQGPDDHIYYYLFNFILTYSFNFDILSTSPPRCFICNRIKCLLQYDGIYFRGESSEYAHVSCAKPHMERVDTETAISEIIQLPDEGDIFPSLIIRKFSKIDPEFSAHHDHYNKKCHDHDLILHDNNNNNNNSTAREGLICDVCTQPIDSSSPFFRCKLPDCAFLVHTICANLPPILMNRVLWQMERCYLINSNGFEFDLYRDELFKAYNLECRLTPQTIQHASHPQHFLSNVAGQLHHFQLRCCPDFKSSGGRRIYRCIACEFYIHMRCALLPKRTRHKSDEHPLELITATTACQLECCFCEFCEEDINQLYWYYGCRKCEHYFHVNCIPSVGRLSRAAKFGKTLDDAKIHGHPVAVTRMLTIGRHEKCHICDKRIKGFEDEIAFHCSECDFWTHFDCAHMRMKDLGQD